MVAFKYEKPILLTSSSYVQDAYGQITPAPLLLVLLLLLPLVLTTTTTTATTTTGTTCSHKAGLARHCSQASIVAL